MKSFIQISQWEAKLIADEANAPTVEATINNIYATIGKMSKEGHYEEQFNLSQVNAGVRAIVKQILTDKGFAVSNVTPSPMANANAGASGNGWISVNWFD